MDIFEPIREILFALIESDKPTKMELEKNCGIISTYYPPSELYPKGHKVEYKFAIKPNEIDFYKWES